MNIWEGIYDHWEDAPEIDEAFSRPQWLDSSLIQAKESLDKLQAGQDEISENTFSRDYILPVVCAMAQKQGGLFRVLDFGGGLASSFCSVISSLHSTDDFEFHVVEGRSICDQGKEVFPKGMNLYFHDEIPNSCGRFDIIHAGSSLQYIDDWRGLLASFAALKPQFLILADVLAGNIKSFVTIQNYYGQKIRARFLNLQGLINEAEKLGFQILYKSLYISRILGKEGTLPMKNLPEERRLEYPCQLLFKFNPP